MTLEYHTTAQKRTTDYWFQSHKNLDKWSKSPDISMADQQYKQTVEWIHQQKLGIEGSGYGRNMKGVQESIAKHQHTAKVIHDFKRQVDQVILKTFDDAEKEYLCKAYEELLSLSEKKMNCLKTLLEISSLEDNCGSLSHEFDLRAVHLVSPAERGKVVGGNTGDQRVGFVAPSAQECIYAAKDNWEWQLKLVKCMETHIKNAADYHQFFHDTDESEHWLMADLKRLQNAFRLEPYLGDYNDAQRLLSELQELITALKQWETKSSFQWDQALKIVPVHLRTNGVTQATPVRAICDYKTSEIRIRENEDLLLLDNTQATMWKVRNNEGKEAMVPALIILIPGPYKDALEAAVNQRLRLLAAWTNMLKRIGKRLICFMLLVFKPDYNADEIKTLKSIKNMDKAELMRILNFIEETLSVHWGDHEAFINLQERMLALNMILEEAGDNPLQDPNVCQSLVVQITLLEKLMDKYKELWRDWELFKVALETCRAPELMLIVDKWEQLQYVTKEYFSKFWQMDLALDDQEREALGIARKKALKKGTGSLQHGEGFVEEMVEEAVALDTSAMLGSSANAAGDSTDFGYASEVKSAETEQISSTEMEEKKTFIIRSVVDSLTNNEVSLQEAIMSGIINPNEGVYFNSKEGQAIPIPIAMSQGLIKVEFTSTKLGKEKKSSIGLVTVKTTKEAIRPYIIKGVKDIATGQVISQDEASSRGIIDEAAGVYRDHRARREMHLQDAIIQGLVNVEYLGEVPPPDVVSTSYAIRAVVDRRIKDTITFSEAVRRGIINKETGSYVDTLTHETMYIGDAIMRGFLKARQIEDTNGSVTRSLDIDPENHLVVDKTESIRKKLIQPLGVIGAFRNLAASGKK